MQCGNPYSCRTFNCQAEDGATVIFLLLPITVTLIIHRGKEVVAGPLKLSLAAEHAGVPTTVEYARRKAVIAAEKQDRLRRRTRKADLGVAQRSGGDVRWLAKKADQHQHLAEAGIVNGAVLTLAMK